MEKEGRRVRRSGVATTGAHSCSGSFMLCLSGLDCNELDLTVATYLSDACLREIGRWRLDGLTWPLLTECF
ncbi:hypothetical protein TSMEX_002511 [Taenia solium]|eukprot:TsM_000283300 transcript=TsM_000283300 gene=TsM_000283300